MMHGQKNIKLN